MTEPTNEDLNDTVSLTERIETRRKSRAKRWWIAAATLVAVLALLAAGWFTPLLALQRVEVTGAKLSDPDKMRSAVLESYRGVPLPQIRLGDTGRALERQFPKTHSVSVAWSGPRSLHVSVTDRVPRAALKSADGWVRYDAEGRRLDTVDKDPGLPTLAGSAHGAASVRAAIAVLEACTADQRKHIDAINAGNTDRITIDYRYTPEEQRRATSSPGDSAAPTQQSAGNRESSRRVKIVIGDTQGVGTKMRIALRLAATGKDTVDVSVPTRPVTR